MTSENALQLPIAEDVAGESVSFNRLVMADLIAWMNEVKGARRLTAEGKLKQNGQLSPYDRERLLLSIDREEVELQDLLMRAYTPVGIVKVLMMSLAKAGRDVKSAQAILDKIHFKRQAILAQKVLSPPEPEPQKQAEGEANPPEPAATENADAGTGIEIAP